LKCWWDENEEPEDIIDGAEPGMARGDDASLHTGDGHVEEFEKIVSKNVRLSHKEETPQRAVRIERKVLTGPF
jgi:hypothetical protein